MTKYFKYGIILVISMMLSGCITQNIVLGDKPARMSPGKILDRALPGIGCL